MWVTGIDFTSAPRRSKPITALHCRFERGTLRALKAEAWTRFDVFEADLNRPGPWIAGMDFPFGQARTFIENIGWPQDWAAYVRHAGSLDRLTFREMLNAYRTGRSKGDKEHRRKTDAAAGSVSPQKLYGVPVALMFHEGAPRLLRSGVTIPHLRDGDAERLVVEAYPGCLARRVIGRRTYKHDNPRKRSEEQTRARAELLDAVRAGSPAGVGFAVQPGRFAEDIRGDSSGDLLDALLCAIQAAWAWHHRDQGFGAPGTPDPLEGWIADPGLADAALTGP